MAATPARDGSTWSSMTSTPTTRGRSPPPPAYSGNPTPTATATADTAPGISKETSGASAPAQFHSMGAGRAPGDAAHQIDPICMTQLMSAGGTLLARADIACGDDRGRCDRRQRSGRLARQVPGGSFPATLAWPSLAPSSATTRKVYAADRPRNRPGCPGRGALARAGRNAAAAAAAAAVPAAAVAALAFLD